MIDLSVVRPGSVLLLHSAYGRLFKTHRCKPETFIQALLDRLGSEGTLLLPLFNFSFTKGESYDIRSTPSKMGALTEAGRHWPESVRTSHPIYSFAAIGYHAKRFGELTNKSAYGPDSPFALLREMNGDVAILDLTDQNAMTFYHYIEECLNVDYRFSKTFSGDYTDWNGYTDSREYTMFVRDLEKGVLTSVDRMGERLWELGLYRGDRPKVGTGLRAINAQELYKAVKKVIESGQAADFLYEIDQPK